MANVVATPRKYKRKAILVKIENVVGVDAAPSPLQNWIEARNVSYEPMGTETVERNIETEMFGNGGTLNVEKFDTLSFECAVVGSGTLGTPPKFAPLLQVCGFAQTILEDEAVIYNLVSEAIPTVSVYIYMDGALHKMLGVRGNAALTLSAKGIPVIKFELQSIFTAPTAETFPGLNKTGWQVERPVTAKTTDGMTINGKDMAYSAFELNLGNQITRVNLPGPQEGIEITDRKPTCSATVLAQPQSVFDPYALAEDGGVFDLSTAQDDRPGCKVQIDAKVRVLKAAYTDINGMLGHALTLEPFPVNGNDEIALTFC